MLTVPQVCQRGAADGDELLLAHRAALLLLADGDPDGFGIRLLVDACAALGPFLASGCWDLAVALEEEDAAASADRFSRLHATARTNRKQVPEPPAAADQDAFLHAKLHASGQSHP